MSGILAAAFAPFRSREPIAPAALGAEYNRVDSLERRADRAARRVQQAEARSRAIGGSGTRISAGIIESLDPNYDLRGPKWYGNLGRAGVSDKMQNDGDVRASLNYVSAPLLSATWRCKAGGARPIDREAAEYATWCFVERIKWIEYLKRTVHGYCANGFELVEMTDDYAPIPVGRFPLHPGGGRGLVPTGLHQIPASSVYQWQQTPGEPTRLASIVQYVMGSDTEEAGFRTIPAERILRFTWDQRGANFEGFPLLRSAYAPWKMKQAFLTIWAMKHERVGLPTPVATASAEASTEDKDEAEKALAEMRANARGYLVLDAGWTFKWEGATTSDGSNLELAIQICNQAIAYNVGAAFMLLGITGKTGSYALGSAQQGQYHLAEKAQAMFVAGVWNLGSDGWSPIERIVRANYGEDVALPVIEAQNLPTSPAAERLPLLINAKSQGLVRADGRTENRVRELLELDPYDPDTAIETAKAPPAPLPTGEPAKNDGTDGAGMPTDQMPPDDASPPADEPTPA